MTVFIAIVKKMTRCWSIIPNCDVR